MATGKTESYKDVLKQIEALHTRAEKLRKVEVEGVIEKINEAIGAYGIKQEDLLFTPGEASARTPKKHRRAAAPATAPVKRAARKMVATKQGPDHRSKGIKPMKYTDGKGNFWSGWAKRPMWFRELIAAGKTPEDLLIKKA